VQKSRNHGCTLGIAESDVRLFITKSAAMVDGHLLDYLTVTIPNGRAARSWSEHAKVICGDRNAKEICDEVWGHIDDILSSAQNEGKSEALIRIHLYRAKAPSGSRTFRTDLAPNGSDMDGDDDYGNGQAMAGAMVAGMRELRLTVKDLLGTVQMSAGEGWKLAHEFMKQSAKLTQDNTELQIALVASDNTSDDPIKAIGAKAANDFIDVMKAKAFANLQKEIESNNKPKE